MTHFDKKSERSPPLLTEIDHKLPRLARSEASSTRDVQQTTRILLICPSLKKQCGIARYSEYVHSAMAERGYEVELLASTEDAISDWDNISQTTFILVQHEYGLFDSFTELGRGETTSEMLANLDSIRRHPGFKGNIALIMHTLVLEDHVLNTVNKQIFSSGFPVFSLSSEGTKTAKVNFLEHGIHQASAIRPPPAFANVSEFRIGAFGLLSPNKDLSSLFHLCEATGAQLHANFACADAALRERYSAEFQARGLRGCLQFEFLAEEDLAQFLSDANVLYLPQHEISHFATSGSARFAIGIGRPLIVPAHRPFHDIVSCAVFADLGGAISAVRDFANNPHTYERAVQAVGLFVADFPIWRVYADLLGRLANHDYVIGGCIPAFDTLRFTTPADFRLQSETLGTDVNRLMSRRYKHAREAISRTGQIPVNGKLLQCLTGSDQSKQQRSFKRRRRETAEIVEDYDERGRVAIALEAVSTINGRWEATVTEKAPFKTEVLDSLLCDFSGQASPALASISLLRLFGLDYGSFPLLEFLDLPLIVQCIFFRQQKLLNDRQVETLCRDIAEARQEAPDLIPSQHLPTFLFLVAVFRRLPFWGQSKVRLRWSERQSFELARRDPVRHPAGILADDPRRFIIAAYLAILGRVPDRDGLTAYTQHLNAGMTRHDVISALLLSPEYQQRGAACLYGDAALLKNWDENFKQILSVFSTLCPDQAKAGLKNYRYWDTVHMDRVNDRL